MKKKYFLKSQSSLQRKFIAGGLAATFAFGTVGSGFAGAMEFCSEGNNNIEIQEMVLPTELKHNILTEDEEDKRVIEEFSKALYESKNFKDILKELREKETLENFAEVVMGEIRILNFEGYKFQKNNDANFEKFNEIFKKDRGFFLDFFIFFKFSRYQSKKEDKDQYIKEIKETSIEKVMESCAIAMGFFDINALDKTIKDCRNALTTFSNFFKKYNKERDEIFKKNEEKSEKQNSRKKVKRFIIIFGACIILAVILFCVIYFPNRNKNKPNANLDNTQKGPGEEEGGETSGQGSGTSEKDQVDKDNKGNQKTVNKIGRRVVTGVVGAGLGMGLPPVVDNILANGKEKTDSSSTAGSINPGHVASYTKGKTDRSRAQSYDKYTYVKDIKMSEEKNTDDKVVSSVSQENKESDTEAKE